MSRNMELVAVLPMRPSGGDQFRTTFVDYHDGATTKRKHLIVFAHETRASEFADDDYDNKACIRIADVTDPRNPKSDYLRIYVRGNAGGSPNPLGNINHPVVYRDEQAPTEETFSGDVFVIGWCGGQYSHHGGLPVDVDEDEENEQPNDNDSKARFLVFNLSRAIQMCEGENANSTRHQIEVMNAGLRNVSYSYNGTTPASIDDGNVYVGYVPSDYEWLVKDRHGPADRRHQQDPHSISIDQQAGFMTFSTHQWHSSTATGQRAFLDCFDLLQLADIPIVNNTTSTPTAVDRLMMVDPDNNQATIPILLPTFTDNSLDYTSNAHDVDIDRLDESRVRLTIASPSSDRDRRTHADVWNLDTYSPVASGVVLMEVDYGTPNACQISNTRWWQYDADRKVPHRRRAQEQINDKDWQYRVCHSAVGFVPTATPEGLPYILTTDEIIVTHGNPDLAAVTTSGSKYVGGNDPLGLNRLSALTTITNDDEDDRRIGAYLRVWKTAKVSEALEVAPRGSGSDDGPLTIYDAPQADGVGGVDDLYYASRRSLPTTDISVNVAATARTTSPSTMHRPHAVKPYEAAFFENDDDVLVSAYTQGVRVINLRDVTATTSTVHEKAFFDFFPKLSYDAVDEYFYKFARVDPNHVGYQPWNKVHHRIGNYFLGVWHALSDFGPERATTAGLLNAASTPPVRLPADEKFVYAMGWGEGRLNEKATAEAMTLEPDHANIGDGRNWLHEGGFMVLRYYDGKLGGTITGYTGTNAFDNRSYRTLNLQGPFDVERDVTIAAGMCVVALPGHASDPGIFTETSFSRPGGQTIYVDGLLLLSVEGGDPEGTDIVVDVPIVVRPGGKLIMNPIATGKRIIIKRPITVQPGGEWTFNAGANVELRAQQHTCNGHFDVRGTSDNRVTITSNKPTSGPYSYTNQVAVRRTGGGTLNASSFHMQYCDSRNVGYSFADMVTDATSLIEHSSFVRTAGGAGLTTQAFLSFSDRLSTPRRHNVRIEECSFLDEAVTFPTAMITNGITIGRAADVSISACTFEHLNAAIVPVLVNHVWLGESTIERCSLGLSSDANNHYVCKTEFENTQFSISLYDAGNSTLNSNAIGNTDFGVRSQGGGKVTYWRNEFDWYSRALWARGAGSHRLRDYLYVYLPVNPSFPINPWEVVQCGGHNRFAQSATRPTHWPAPQQFVDIEITGINGGIPDVTVACGHNMFSADAQFHAASNVAYPPLDATYNRWAPDPFEPRVNAYMTWFGDELDQGYEVGPGCAVLCEVDEECYPAVEIVRWNLGFGFTRAAPPSTADIHHAIDTNRTVMTNTAFTAAERRLGAWATVVALTQSDSVALYTTVRGELAAIAANTSLPGFLRSSALALRAKTFVARNSLDTAKAMYYQIVANHGSQADSLNAVWSIMALDAIMDTTGVRDSLFGFYIDRVIADLSAAAADTSGMQKSLAWFVQQGNTSGATDELTILGVATVAQGTTNVAQGTTTATLDIPSVPTGSYILRCQAGNTTKVMRLTIQR